MRKRFSNIQCHCIMNRMSQTTSGAKVKSQVFNRTKSKMSAFRIHEEKINQCRDPKKQLEIRPYELNDFFHNTERVKLINIY